MQQVVDDQRYALVIFDAATGRLILQWRGFAHSTEFRAAMLRVLEHVKTSPLLCRALLFDARDLGPVVHADIEWAACVLGAQLCAAGVQRLALIPPQTALGRVTFGAFRQAAQDTLMSTPEVQLFDSVESAECWLEE